MSRQPTNRIERIQPETLVGQYFFRDLYNRDVYFEDFDDKSSDYFRLDYDPSMKLHGGKNLIAIRGNSTTMELNSEILIEVIDQGGQIVKSQVYDLNDEIHNRVISIDINPNTPPGDVIVTIMGVASVAPDGTSIPNEWIGIPNFRWTRVFSANPFAPNNSKIIYNNFSKPSIKIEEVLEPFHELHFNTELSSSIGWTGNSTSSYTLSSSVNTNCQVEYLKSGDKYVVSAKMPSGGSSTIDFGGFTQDMEGGILIVRDPQTPRPSSITSFNAPPVYAETENGDGIFDEATGTFIQGAYLTTILEVLSPNELCVTTPHSTWQGLTAGTYQELEHVEFEASNFELIWAETPISYSVNPTGSSGQPLNTSYAKVTFDNLEPLTGDVTRIKCFIRNAQAPFDWVLASDNAVWAQELLYRRDFQKHRAPIGDFSQWGVANLLDTYWTGSGVGTDDPILGIFTQTGPTNPPIEDSLVVGNSTSILNLDGTAYWWLRAKESASFVENQWYELSLKAMSEKAQVPSFGAGADAIAEPKVSIYMSGSAFTDGGDDYGKFIGLIEDTNVRKKYVEIDEREQNKEVPYKFIFKADGTETAIPQFKIDSGLWYFWDISIKPWDRQGYTPGTWDVIFPTVKANVGIYDSLDFKFEFYNDNGAIANYTADVYKVPWVNDLTATYTNVVANTVLIGSGGLSSSGCITASCFTSSVPVTFNGGPFTFNGPVTFSSGVTSSGGGLGGGCSDVIKTVAANDSNTWSATGCNGTLKILGAGGITSSITTPGEINISMSSTYLTNFINNVGGGGADNLGNHIATRHLDMNHNWITQSDGYGHHWVGVSGSDEAKIWRDTNNTLQHTNTNTNNNISNVFSIHNDNSGFHLRPNDLANRGMQIEADNDWYYYNLDNVSAIKSILTYDELTGKIEYANSGQHSIGGGSGGCGCEFCKPFADAVDSYFYLINGQHTSTAPSTTKQIGCPTTIGGGELFQQQYTYNAHDRGKYAPKSWFQVNNWSAPYNDEDEDIGYSAVFTNTSPPFRIVDDGGQTHLHQGRAGHGIRVMTSTIPVAVSLKGTGLHSCMDNTGMNYPMSGDSNNSAISNALPNAYYIDFHHHVYDTLGDNNQVTFAGGIRKDCINYANTIVMEFSSDRRLKENIEDTSTGINTLMDIHVRDFDYIATPESHRSMKTTGFIAQELIEVYPQAAFGDEEGDPNTAPMTVAPDRLIPLLIKSVQDQQQIITNLETRIKQLEKSDE